MNDWDRLIEASRELSLAFRLLDRTDAITCFSSMAITTGEGLISAAHDAVSRANILLRRN